MTKKVIKKSKNALNFKKTVRFLKKYDKLLIERRNLYESIRSNESTHKLSIR